MTPVWRVEAGDFVWADLPPDEEAARIASKHPYKSAPGPSDEPVGDPPQNLLFQHPRGGLYKIITRAIPPTKVETVPYLVTRQYGVRSETTGLETWSPPGSEGPTRPDVTVNTVRSLCGIVELERKVASLEAQNRALQGRVAELEAQRVRVRTA